MLDRDNTLVPRDMKKRSQSVAAWLTMRGNLGSPFIWSLIIGIKNQVSSFQS